LLLFSWTAARSVIAQSRARPDLAWAGDLARMIQVSLVAYMTGGAFLSVLYFDVPYFLMVALVGLRGLMQAPVAAPSVLAARDANGQLLPADRAGQANPVAAARLRG
jgi:hypothetical protein